MQPSVEGSISSRRMRRRWRRLYLGGDRFLFGAQAISFVVLTVHCNPHAGCGGKAAGTNGEDAFAVSIPQSHSSQQLEAAAHYAFAVSHARNAAGRMSTPGCLRFGPFRNTRVDTAIRSGSSISQSRLGYETDQWRQKQLVEIFST